MGKRLTGLTPSDQLAAQCPTCRGDQRILMWVAATCPDEDDPEITRGYHHPAVRDCPDCGGTGRVTFGG
jgi:hypothetical protein